LFTKTKWLELFREVIAVLFCEPTVTVYGQKPERLLMFMQVCFARLPTLLVCFCAAWAYISSLVTVPKTHNGWLYIALVAVARGFRLHKTMKIAIFSEL
jgi:hypothetical protein